MGLLKRAAVRGVAHELVRNGLASFPSKLAMDAAADAVADGPAAAPMPEEAPAQGHAPDHIAQVAAQLMQMAQELMAASEGGGGAPGSDLPPPAEAKQAAEELTKVAQSYSLEDFAYHEAERLMNKVAEEVKAANAGSKADIAKAENKNTPEAAAKHEGLAALDQKQRGTEQYHVGQGKTDMHTSQGMIGDLGKQPAAPKNSPSGGNSLTEDAKHAFESLRAAIVKQAASVASKVEIAKGENKNTAASAAGVEGLAALDKKQRPENYAHVGQGNANFKEPQAHRVGGEQPHPEAPRTKAPGSNSVIEASKAAAESLTEEEGKAYLTLLEKCAADVGDKLPGGFSNEQKIAALSTMIGMTAAARNTYLGKLASAKTAGDLADLLGMGHEEKKEDKKEEKKEDKKDEAEEKKAGLSLMERVAEIASRAGSK